MRALIIVAAFAVTIVMCAFPNLSDVKAQMASNNYATKFFLDKPAPTIGLAEMPKNADDVIAAKVRLIGRIYSLAGRDQSGLPPAPVKDLFGAELEIIEVLQGNATKGARYNVAFGERGPAKKYFYPHTPAMRSHEYFVVFYRSEGVRRLAGYPASPQDYETWESEVRNYERSRGRPGVSE